MNMYEYIVDMSAAIVNMAEHEAVEISTIRTSSVKTFRKLLDCLAMGTLNAHQKTLEMIANVSASNSVQKSSKSELS